MKLKKLYKITKLKRINLIEKQGIIQLKMGDKPKCKISV